MATSIIQLNTDSQLSLPTKWVPGKKPPYRESLLDHEELKRVVLKHNRQPALNRNEAEKLKNNFKKQLCIEMLKEGYHKSFRELDFILKLQIKERHRVGSEHPVWSRPLLDHEEEKLSYLCRKLNKAEAAERSGEFKILYTNYFDLANYFIITDDSWLSDYFFQKCLGITDGPGIFSDNRQLEPELQAEAECNIGFSFEKQNSYFKAVEHYEKYYNLSKGQNWIVKLNLEDLNNDDIAKLVAIKRSTIEPDLAHIEYSTMFEDACMHLQRLYKVMANRYATNQTEKIEYLTKVYDVCKSSGIKKLEGQASFLLGQAYEENRNLEATLSCYNSYYEISKEDTNSEDYGKAAEAMAKCHQRLGQINKSIAYLEKYLKEVSSDQQGSKQYARACSCLASIYNSLGKYDMATDFSRKAFEASRQMSNSGAIDFNRVLFGIAKAHKNLSLFNKNIELKSRKTITNLLCWKYNEEKESALENVASE